MRKFKMAKEGEETENTKANRNLEPGELEEISVSSGSVTVLLDFKNAKEDAYGKGLYKILTKSRDNAHKVPPQEILDPCEADYANFVKAENEMAVTPIPENTKKRNEEKKKSNVSFTNLARWVAENCNDDPAIAMSYGFNVGKETRSRATQPGKLTILEWWYADPGTVNFRTSSGGRDVHYFVKCRLFGTDDPFIICGDSTSSFKITAKGLVRGKEYEFMLYAANTAGDGVPVFTAGIIAAI